MNPLNVSKKQVLLAALWLGAFGPLAVAQSSAPTDMANANADPDAVVRLDDFVVTGTRPNAVDVTTLKTPARILETPRSVSIIDAARLEAQDFQNADDVLNWIPGLNANAGSYHFFARGFRMGPSDWKVDGFGGRVVGGSYSPNLFGYENVVALKGPAGLLYGASGQPGGQINLVTKKPRDVALVSLDTRFRTYGGGEVGFGDRIGAQLELDATGPLTADRRLRYRTLLAVERALDRPAAEDDNQFYRLSFAYTLDADNRFEIAPILEWSRENRATRGTEISPSTSASTTDGDTSYTLADASSRAVNLAGGGRVDDNFTTGFDFTGELSRALRLQSSFRFHDRTYDNNAWTPQTATLRQTDPLDARSWVVERRHNHAARDYEDLTLDTNLSYDFTLGARVRSTVQLGWNALWNEQQAYTASNGANQSAINLYTGATSAALVADADEVLARGERTKSTAWNTYLQSRTTFFDQLIINLGTGYAGDRNRSIAASGIASAAVNRDSGVTPNVGAVYVLNDKLALYASHSTSYSLPDATLENVDGRTGTFDPAEGDSIEAGVKAELWGDLVAATATVFQTELNGVLVGFPADEQHPDGTYYRQLDAGRKSQGLELEFTIAPTAGWNTTVTYAYIDAFDRAADGSRAGRASMTPRHAASVFSRYTFASGALEGWTLQAGVLAQSDRVGGQAALHASTNTDPLRLRSFQRVDLGVSRHWRHWNLAVLVENVANTDYLLGGSTGLNLQRANPRAYTLRVGHDW